MKLFTNKQWNDWMEEYGEKCLFNDLLSSENEKLRAELKEKQHRMMYIPTVMPNYWEKDITEKYKDTIQKWEKEVNSEMIKKLKDHGIDKTDGKLGIRLVYYK